MLFPSTVSDSAVVAVRPHATMCMFLFILNKSLLLLFSVQKEIAADAFANMHWEESPPSSPIEVLVLDYYLKATSPIKTL